MKMNRVERFFVNGSLRGRGLTRWADRVLRDVHLRRGQSALDVGCGVGTLVLYLAERCGLKTTGVDVDPLQISEAVRRADGLDGARFLVNDACRLQFGDAEFDLVLTFKTMHHIADWQLAMDEMVRVLKPGGWYVFADFVLPAWLPAMGIGDFGHITSKQLAGFAARQRLSVVRAGQTGMVFELIARKEWPQVSGLASRARSFDGQGGVP